MAKRKGFLTIKTYFPKTGDVLIASDDPEVGAWECARSNTFVHENGTKKRYALFVAEHEDMGLLDMSVSESTDMDEFLAPYDSIHRKGKDYKRGENGVYTEVE